MSLETNYTWTPERIAFNRDQAQSLKISRCDDSLVALLSVESISALAEIERLQAENKLLREVIGSLDHQKGCSWYFAACDCPKSKVPAK